MTTQELFNTCRVRSKEALLQKIEDLRLSARQRSGRDGFRLHFQRFRDVADDLEAQRQHDMKQLEPLIEQMERFRILRTAQLQERRDREERRRILMAQRQESKRP